MMRTHDVIFSQRSLASPEANMYVSKGIIFCPYGDYWRQLRRVCTQELLSLKCVKSFRSIREEEVASLIGDLHSSKGSLAINLNEKIFSLTCSITARAAFGKKCKKQEAFIEIVKEDKATSMDEDEAESLLDVLSNIQGHGDHEFSLETRNIKAVILDIFIAGGETSSTVVEWAMSEMLKNPKVMEKAQAEVRLVFGGKENVNEEDLHKLEFMDLVIKEFLRLHPPVTLLPRESRESSVIVGYQIPEKTKIIFNTWEMGRDPKYWSDPEMFYPESFDGESGTTSSTDFKGNDFEFIPFGARRRMCPEMLFAMADIKLPLAQLLFHFDWKLPDGINHESFDMSESLGLTVKRKRDLYLIPIPCVP
ncbi:Cytochrome P450, E-class, group IV [Parasponia andersonii]|uniref:Cytochrome P450, E-class, group IV n=1 Tax=Parasponia andersonii TaxID=3476 RepID=A0A2P5AU87_PARAD|nr:Cytochrome P450, E-class, group IV [Parasponia andersonii]